MTNIQQKIQETLSKISDLRKVSSHLNSVSKELNDLQTELNRLEKHLDKELKDVEALESLSMKSIFHKVLGSKEEQLEKERQEYLQLSLKRNELKKRIELMEFEQTLLEGKIEDAEVYEKVLEKLKHQRENELIRSHSEMGNKILAIADKIEKFYLAQKELKEAQLAGNVCISTLDQIISYLKKAKQWGNWDMMGSRRNMGAYYKHDAIDRAKNLSFRARHELFKFQEELNDVGKHYQIQFNVNLESFSRFVDIFFDNLISDWILQQKIVNALNNVKSVRDQISRIHKSLEVDISKTEKLILENQDRKDKLLLS
jgi:hypothetical protein